jgi:ketosteroid isomerase-like protein
MDVDVKAQETAHACEALSHRYFVALDAGDAAAFGALFAEDAVLTVPSAT